MLQRAWRFCPSFMKSWKNNIQELLLKKTWRQSHRMEFILLYLAIYRSVCLSLYHRVSFVWGTGSTGWTISDEASQIRVFIMEESSVNKLCRRCHGDELIEEFEKQNSKVLASCDIAYTFKPFLLILIV